MGHDVVNAYKADSRTMEELISDMKKGIQNESVAIRQFQEILQKSQAQNPEIIFVGSEKEGEVVMDEENKVANIDLFPDYMLKLKKSGRMQYKLIEVKICNPHSLQVYLKTGQLRQYVDLGNVLVLFIMGFQTRYPMFALFTPAEILQLELEPQMIYGKETLSIPVSYFNWDVFAPIERKHSHILDKRYIKDFVQRKSVYCT